jgi:predicted HTH domain antitoxin
MPPTLSIEIPAEIAHAVKMSSDDLRRELAIHLFSIHKLSFGKAREMAGMTVCAFQQLLGSREISPHYDIADYEEDLATLSKLGRL